MGLIDVKSVKKEFSGEVLFDNITFSLNKEDKMAIIGNNGVGKTTLLKMILQVEKCDAGSISYANHLRVGYLSQVMIDSFDNTLYEEMLLAFREVRELENQLRVVVKELENQPDNPTLLEKYGRLENMFLAQGGYDYPYLIELMISKFGFQKEDYHRPIKTFSGGERNKISFSKLLLNHPDVLILDEPTNHLDMSTIEWLEDYLRTYDGAILLVSHDRYFIDSVCNVICEIANHTSEIYRGNYTFYLEQKVMRYEQRLKAYQLQESEIQKLNMLIQKFKPKPNKVSFAKDREKKLERILSNKLNRPTNQTKKLKVHLQARVDQRVRQMTVTKLSYGYEEKPLSNSVDFILFNGDKLAIIGDNGVGKTTLLKTLAGMIPKIDGEILHHRKMKIGYIDQNQIHIESTETIFDYFHNMYPMMSHYEIRSHLGTFLFTGDDVEKTINQLSGGEKVRLSFAKLVLQKYDILLLDEPTNHLDIDTKKVLENTLVAYPGTIVFVSHDRYFVDELASRVLEIKQQMATFYEGDYQHYLLLSHKQESNKNLNVTISPSPIEEMPKGKVKTPKFNKVKIEEQIRRLEDKIASLHLLYEEEDYYTDARKLEALDQEIDIQEIELRNLTQFYLENIDK